MNNIKILVGYHKPAVLLKSDVLVPIHLGRALATEASKDGEMSQEDYQWMLDNMIGDDTGDNISDQNREFCELTGIYWAWKNYDKLGNPDYIGFMHYRRHFIFNKTINNISNPDIFNLVKIPEIDINYLDNLSLKQEVMQQLLDSKSCIYSYNYRKDTPLEYRRKHWACPFNDYKKCIEIVEEKYPDFKDICEYYNSGHKHIWSQMFILSKEDFFSYCKWLFDILFELDKNINYDGYNINQRRSVAYCGETLNGIYASFLEQKKFKIIHSYPMAYIEHTELPFEINKAFGNDGIPIVFATDKNYYAYLSVTLQSLIMNKNQDTKYDIIILEMDLDEHKKNRLEHLSSDNVSIRVFNITNIVNRYKINNFMTINHIKESAYYRLLVSEILANYDKIIYLDCDLVALNDLSELYNTNLDNKYAAAVQDYLIANIFIKGKEFVNYMNNVLQIKNLDYYFNSGVMLFNLDLMRRNKLQNKLLEIASINNKYFHDQNVLNSAFYQQVIYLDGSYNVNYHLIFDKHKDEFSSTVWERYLKELDNPKILHFTSSFKPWTDPSLPNAYIWWHYARQTPFYEEILYKNLKVNQIKNTASSIIPKITHMDIVRDINNYSKNRFNYYRCKLLANLTFGKMRKHYKDKKKKLKAKIKAVKQFLKEK